MSCKQEFDEKLIDCLRNFPVIYDPIRSRARIGLPRITLEVIATALERDSS